MMRYRTLVWKRRIESCLLSPFVALGRLIARLCPLSREYRVFFFFPFYHTGGAEKVHAQIVQAAGGSDCIVYFTRKSQSNTFRQAFLDSGAQVRDISRWTDNKLIYFANFIWRGILSGYINRQRRPPVVFQGHSNIAYKTAPWIHKNIRQIDLVHSLNTFSVIRLPFLSFYAETVLISKVKMQAHEDLYRKLGVPEDVIARMRYIGNAVELPKRTIADKPGLPFTVLFSGRPGPEKRPLLFLRIAAALRKAGHPAHFVMMGATAADFPGIDCEGVEFLGNVSDDSLIRQTYWRSHLLLLTSETEGMPLVVPEAMGNGCAILATPVGDLPLHIDAGRQGWLFSTITDEEAIIGEAAKLISALYADLELQRRIGAENIAYAHTCFSMDAFRHAYRSLLTTTYN